MRMWMINPELLCKNHLLGEHSEIHKHKNVFVKHYSIKKRVERKQIQPEAMKSRHDELVVEMKRRGYNHNSEYEMPDLSYLNKEHRTTKVDKRKSIVDLLNRCNECKQRIIERYTNE